jgi:hypothetical protein
MVIILNRPMARGTVFCSSRTHKRSIEKPPTTVPVGSERTAMVLVEAIIDLAVLAWTTGWQLERGGIA